MEKNKMEYCKMKEIRNLSLGWCVCMAVLFAAMPASSLRAQTNTSKEYRLDSLSRMVDSLMPHLDTMDAVVLFRNYFETIDKVVTPREWTDRMKADTMCQLFEGYSTDSQADLHQLYEEVSATSADSLRQKVKVSYEAMIQRCGHLFPGKPAPNLTFTDMKGKLLSLASFKGQILLVDIWGTWCGPCKEEIPYIAALQKEYANRKDVRIMSIACDKKTEKWKAYLAKHPASWDQYLVTDAGNKMLDEVYFCEGIPRFLIIDKQGRFITSDAMRPSEPAFAEYFKKIVNQEK